MRFQYVFVALIIGILTACGGRSEATETPVAAEATVEAAEVAQPAPDEPAAGAGEAVETTASGLQYVVVEEGAGEQAVPGDIVQVHYTGRLEDGVQFDSSHDRGAPFTFKLGAGRVIPGWDEGIALMKVGGKSKLIIPPHLGYGEQGSGNVIPPNATLYFDVELVNILSPTPMKVNEADYVTTDSGLKYYDIQEGIGVSPQPGQQAVVHYTGWLEDDTRFDSSFDRGQPFVFPVGQGRVIQGWDEGVASMKVGGKRQLVVPPELGYGQEGAGGGVIPPNAVLIFEVELLDVQ